MNRTTSRTITALVLSLTTLTAFAACGSDDSDSGGSDDVPAEVVAAERSIYTNTDEVQSKPEAAREKIVDGMLNKRFFAATPGGALVEQAWIHEPSKNVGQALADSGAKVARFVRISVAGS